MAGAEYIQREEAVTVLYCGLCGGWMQRQVLAGAGLIDSRLWLRRWGLRADVSSWDTELLLVFVTEE